MGKRAVALGIVTIISVLLLAGAGCYGAIRGSGNIVTRSYNLSNFTTVEINSAFQAEISRGNSYSISITADDNMYDFIRVVESSEGTLRIDMRPGYSFFPSILKAALVMPDIENLVVSGASKAELAGFQFSHDFSATVAGASTLTLSISSGDLGLEAMTASQINGVVHAADMKCTASGASRINVSGTARNLHLEGSIASNINLSQLEGLDATVGLSGASSATVNVSGMLDAGLTGASHLTYLDEPELGNINLSDVSTISQG